MRLQVSRGPRRKGWGVTTSWVAGNKTRKRSQEEQSFSATPSAEKEGGAGKKKKNRIEDKGGKGEIEERLGPRVIRLGE